MKLAELVSRRGRLVAEARGLLDKASTEKRDLAENESARVDAIKTEIETLEKRIATETTVAEWERQASADPVSPGRDTVEAEARNFSLRSVIASQIPDIAHTVDVGREREISAELAKRMGRPVQGIVVPMQVFQIKQRVLTTAAPVGGPGGNLIGTDHRGDLFIDILRARLITQGLGARVLSGLTGNVDIPRRKASNTASWIAENAALTPNDPQFDKVQLTPKHVGALTEFSRNMLLQSSPDVEQLIRADFAAVLAEGIDRAAINGGGANEPDGILQTPGIGSFDVSPLSWSGVLDGIADIETANADTGALGWATHPQAVKLMRGTLKVNADAGAGFIMDAPGQLAGYRLASSTVVPTNGSPAQPSLIFGNWNDLMIGYWSAFEILVNPYESTAYAKGNVQVRGLLTCDVAVRHPVSFTAGNVSAS
ncbi:MAG: phage major capsid protein [Micropepsaceae bacterium]